MGSAVICICRKGEPHMNLTSVFFRRQNLILYVLLCFLPFCAGCSFSSVPKNPTAENGTVLIGHTLEVRNNDERLTLLDNKDALAADGLYYAAWTAGNCEPYENKDGDTVDLYDAQLYLLLGEAKSREAAQHDMDTWLAAAKENYDVQKEDTVSCGGNAYTLLTYQCKSADTPYDRGVSAFYTDQNIAVCIELTCRAAYTEDLYLMLTDFLNNCSYS